MLCDHRSCVRVPVDAENTETLTDAIAQSCGRSEGFRITPLLVEATLPNPEEKADPAEADAQAAPNSDRICRKELHADIPDIAARTSAGWGISSLPSLRVSREG